MDEFLTKLMLEESRMLKATVGQIAAIDELGCHPAAGEYATRL